MADKVEAARIRGSLERATDARLIERAARSSCHRLNVIVSAGTEPGRVIEKAYGPDAPVSKHSRISPFARAIGVAFERWLFNDNASVLADVYEQTAEWRPEGVVDLRPLHKGEQDKATEETRRIIAERVKTGSGPELILGARFDIATPSGETHVHPDLLVAKPGWKRFRVADVKSYLDLDGRTDPTEIATAVRQIAVGIVALRRDHGEDAADELVDIVLRTPRRPGAGVRTLDASVEIATITSWLASSGAIVTEALVENGGKPLDTRAGVEAIAHHWDASCEGHCPMSEVCHAEATARGDLMLLGPTVEVALEGVASISRATVLATGGAPVTVDEKRVAADLAAGWAASEAAESLELSAPLS